MRKLTYYIAISIDGFIAGPHGETEFYPVSKELLEHMSTEYPEVFPANIRSALGIDAPNARFDTIIMVAQRTTRRSRRASPAHTLTCVSTSSRSH